MDQLRIEKATRAQSKEGAQLILSTLDEFGTYLFGFGQKKRAISALEKFFSMKGNRFSYTNTLFVFSGTTLAGLLMMYKRTELFYAMAVTACQLLRTYKLKETIKYIKRISPFQRDEEVSQDELYIAHLAVFPKFRRRGIATHLLERANTEALKLGKHNLSLLVSMENKSAISLYKKFGFKIIGEILHLEQEKSTGTAGDYKMIKIIV